MTSSSSGSNDNDGASPPFIGALLRYCWQRVRQQINDDIAAAGFGDLQDSLISFFQYPLPDAVRPSDLARQLKVSRQAANYLILQMEELGYLERRNPRGGGRRLVYLTRRGWQVVDVIFRSLRNTQEQWATRIGEKRFRDFMEVLEIMSSDDSARRDPARKTRRQTRRT